MSNGSNEETMNRDQELKLITSYREGNEKAFAVLFQAHRRRVLKMSIQLLGNEDLALDVAQEVFLRVSNELYQWRGEARLSTWLYRTTLNATMEVLRDEKKNQYVLKNAPDWNPAETLGKESFSNEKLRSIQTAIANLPKRQRVVFVLKQYDEMKFREIAELLNLSEGGVKANYHKALLRLRQKLQRWAPQQKKKQHHSNLKPFSAT